MPDVLRKGPLTTVQWKSLMKTVLMGSLRSNSHFTNRRKDKTLFAGKAEEMSDNSEFTEDLGALRNVKLVSSMGLRELSSSAKIKKTLSNTVTGPHDDPPTHPSYGWVVRGTVPQATEVRWATLRAWVCSYRRLQPVGRSSPPGLREWAQPNEMQGTYARASRGSLKTSETFCSAIGDGLDFVMLTATGTLSHAMLFWKAADSDKATTENSKDWNRSGTPGSRSCTMVAVRAPCSFAIAWRSHERSCNRPHRPKCRVRRDPPHHPGRHHRSSDRSTCWRCVYPGVGEMHSRTSAGVASTPRAGALDSSTGAGAAFTPGAGAVYFTDRCWCCVPNWRRPPLPTGACAASPAGAMKFPTGADAVFSLGAGAMNSTTM